MRTNVPVKPAQGATAPARLFEGTFGFPLFERLSRELDELFGRFPFERPVFEPKGEFWTPDIEMFTKDNTLHVRADLPGLTKEDVTVELTEEALTIRGERKKEKEEKGEGFYRTERSYGTFYRVLPLPEGVKTETAKAEVRDGVLEITMPMAKLEEKKRTLEITEPVPEKTVKAA
jgi:HSP20 family protein